MPTPQAENPRPTESAQGRVEKLLEITGDILGTESKIRIVRLLNLGIAAGILFGPVALVAIVVITIATWQHFDMARIICTALPVMIAAIAGGISCYYYRQENYEYDSVRELKLELSLLRERRRLRSAEMIVDPRYARSAYKDSINKDLDRFRKESRYYRRIHNMFQSVIIIGSLTTTTVSGIALDSSPLQWIVVATSFSVGLAAGFTGYFKYRERGFYLQQTADAIEQEWTAADLAIFRYKSLKEEEQLAAFVEEAERLKSEQRKREQSLDQPSARDGHVNN